MSDPNTEQIEQIVVGLQVLLTDRLLNNVKVTSGREPQIGGGATSIKAMWKTAAYTVSTERIGKVPATFWDYIKKYLPFMEPEMRDIEIHIIHQCPHRLVLEQDPHRHWLTGSPNE